MNVIVLHLSTITLIYTSELRRIKFYVPFRYNVYIKKETYFKTDPLAHKQTVTTAVACKCLPVNKHARLFY